MDAIQQQAADLRERWKAVLETISENPTVVAPYLTTISAAQVDEVVGVVCTLLGRVKAPKGFAPAFHLAKAVSATSLSAALTALTSLQAGQYNFLASFVTALNQVLSGAHTLLAFSGRSESRQLTASLGSELAEGISLVESAQRELKAKVDSLVQASEVADIITSKAEDVEESHTKASAAVTEMEVTQTTATAILKQITADRDEITTLRQGVADLENRHTDLASNLEKSATDLGALQADSQRQTGIITALLPQGASAGLASAFAQRVRQLETAKWIWMGIFISSILILGGFAMAIIQIPQGSTEALWKHVLHRLPLASPFIWLGWFSAIQYGNTIRVQEDYAFKEATSKAFEGYRSHMQHLASVELEEGNNAMTLLAEKTIAILAHEPLRIYSKSERDVSPTHAILEALKVKYGVKEEVAKGLTEAAQSIKDSKP